MENNSPSPHQDYEDCSGCTAPRSEGTHQSHTKQHPCPLGGDPDCGYCFPTQSSSEKLNVVNLPEPFPYKTLNIEVTTHASSSEKDYSHTHCWDQKQPPACGLKDKHKRCCLCDAEQRSSEKEANTTGYSGPPLSFLPNTEQEEMPQRIKNAYQLGAKTERARLRKLVKEKRNNENDGPIRFALFGILSLLEE